MNRRGGFLLASAFLIAFSIFLSQDGAAADFTAVNVGSSTINASAINYPINITITNSDTAANITQVNLTLYGFTFIGPNSTTASNANFSNSSSTHLVWVNYTSNGFIDGNGTSRNFTFNVNATSVPGYYNITVTVSDTVGVQTSNNIIYTLVLHNITFINLTAAINSTATNNNLTYIINITNSGAPTTQQYNLSVVNCGNVSQAGIGTLNTTSLSLGSGESVLVQLTVPGNSTVVSYSSCINASLSVDGGIWNFTSSKDGVMLNSTFYFLDLNATALSFSNSSGGQRLFEGSDVTVNATLLNTGTRNFTGNITVSFLWDGTLVGSQTVANTSLANGTSNNSISLIVMGGNVTNGLHNITVQVDSSGNVAESNETNNNYTNTSVFVGYNVTVLSVKGYLDLNVSSNSSVNITVSVMYGNGNPVTGLGKDNFTLYDIYSGSIVGTTTSSSAVLNSTFNASMNSSGIYWFNITSYSPLNYTDTLPGTHNLTVSVSNNESGNTYSGNSTTNPYPYYYLMVPRLVVTLSASSTHTMSETFSSGKTVTINVTNTGTSPAYNVTISAASSDTNYLTLESLSGCDAIPNVLQPFINFNDCTVVAIPHDVSDNTEETVTVTAAGNHNYSAPVITYAATGGWLFTITNVAATGGTDDEEDGGGGGTIVRSCTSDSSCTASESCNASKKCVAISCPGGEIVDHMCIGASSAYKINITSYNSALEALSGERVSTKVTVKNTGTSTLTAKLEVTINNITANVTPASYSLDTGESYLFTVNFTVPNSTTIGNFSGTFRAYISTNTSVSSSKAFMFTVLPKEETKSEINTSYEELSSLLENLSARLATMNASGRYNQTVLGPLEELLNSANSILTRMKSALESDDYVSAQSLVSQINSSIGGIESGIQDASLQITGALGGQLPEQIWLWVAVIVIIVFVVGFFAYMFYPSSRQGYRSQTGYAPASNGFFSKLKGKLKRKKAPPASVSTLATNIAESGSGDEGHYESFHYSEGYKKERPYDYAYSGPKGFFQKLKKLRRRKDKSPQMHIDQFPASAPATQ